MAADFVEVPTLTYRLVFVLWSSPTIGDASGTLPSRRIRRRRGRSNSCARRAAKITART
jgi:hypothetical protein